MGTPADESQTGEVTRLLRAVSEGDADAPNRLMAIVYEQLRRIAANQIRGESLEPTTLVHDAYLRMMGKSQPQWENRSHFFWAAARAMRDILVERARSASRIKRGGGLKRVSLDEQLDDASQIEAGDLLALNDALKHLELNHPESARIVILKFFAGLNREEIAEQTGLSPATVWREWIFARAWLRAAIMGSDEET